MAFVRVHNLREYFSGLVVGRPDLFPSWSLWAKGQTILNTEETQQIWMLLTVEIRGLDHLFLRLVLYHVMSFVMLFSTLWAHQKRLASQALVLGWCLRIKSSRMARLAQLKLCQIDFTSKSLLGLEVGQHLCLDILAQLLPDILAHRCLFKRLCLVTADRHAQTALRTLENVWRVIKLSVSCFNFSNCFFNFADLN